VGAHQDPVQRAVVFGIAVISTLLDGAFDALVCLAAHNHYPPLFFGVADSLSGIKKSMMEKFSFH
jgi:hypothetical protein